MYQWDPSDYEMNSSAQEIADRYLNLRPLEDGAAMVGMAVLEVEARRPAV
jgi:hypothetical protein